MEHKRVLGVDYGSKMAGTTVVAFRSGDQVEFKSSLKSKDADAMLFNAVEELTPDLVAIDAPLSLPGIFTGLAGCDDYFYRKCDKLTKAMSPMFLGGLTARAMKLAAQLRAMGVEVIEAYPVKAGVDMGLKAFGYRTKAQEDEKMLQLLLKQTGIDLTEHHTLSGHHIDAALALFIAERYCQDEANHLGELPEGLIYY